jgi:hypothetical protein
MYLQGLTVNEPGAVLCYSSTRIRALETINIIDKICEIDSFEYSLPKKATNFDALCGSGLLQ